MKAVRLMVEAYKLLMDSADSMRVSKLDKERPFEHLLRALEELAVSLTDMRALGKLDSETAMEVTRTITEVSGSEERHSLGSR